MTRFEAAMQALQDIPIHPTPEGDGNADGIRLLLERAGPGEFRWLRENLHGLLFYGLRLENGAPSEDAP